MSDTYRNRVLKLQYSATTHGVPPKVTEFVTGLNEPWDVIAVGVQLYVSDRMNHAIKVFDMDTGALVKSIPVLQPEGMALLDGWLYYASIATKSIRKINLATGQNVLIADPTVTASKFAYFLDDNNSRYMKIAVSDGSFGPRGMIAYTTWSNRNFGYPNLIDGTTGAYDRLPQRQERRDVSRHGAAGAELVCARRSGIGAGRMLFGTAEEGLHVASQALPTDPVIDMKKYTAGMDQWQAKGYSLDPRAGGLRVLRAAVAVGRDAGDRLLPEGQPARRGRPPAAAPAHADAQRYGVALDRGIRKHHDRADRVPRRPS